MSETTSRGNEESKGYYRVVLRGRLEGDLHPWFDGLSIKVDDGTTILSGPMRDQAELHGLLRKIHDLHLTLLSVELMKGRIRQ